MNTLVANGVDIHYDIQGQGPWITFAHSLACDLHQWDEQAKALAADFTVLRYDLRGHGRSGTPPAPWTFADLVADLTALWDALGIARSHFVGLSLGGMIGQHLALDHPDRLARLVLCATTSSYGTNRDSVARLWEQRIAQVNAKGMDSVVEATLGRWFTEPYACEEPDVMARIAAAIRATPVAGYAACGRLVSTMETTARLPEIRVPTLVIGGEEDGGTTPDMMTALARGIAGARLEILPQASHLVNVEQAQLFNALLLAFLVPA